MNKIDRKSRAVSGLIYFLITISLVGLVGCAFIQDWIDHNPIPNPPNPTVTTTTTIPPTPEPSTNGFVFGNWKWLGGIPCSKDAQVIAHAKILSAKAYSKSKVTLTYAPEASQTKWWQPYDAFCYGPHAAQYQAADGNWYAGRADWFPIQLRNEIEIKNYWVSDTPFKDHPPVVGKPFYFFVYSKDGKFRSNAIQMEWVVANWWQRTMPQFLGGWPKDKVDDNLLMHKNTK